MLFSRSETVIWHRSRDFGRLGVDLRDMPHLPAWARRPLAVEMYRCAWNGQPLRVGIDFVADQVGHGHPAVPDGLAERPARNGPDMLLELRNRGPVEGPMSRIMYPRRDLVDQDLRSVVSGDHEQFNRQHADVIEGGRDLLGNAARFRRERVGDCGGGP